MKHDFTKTAVKATPIISAIYTADPSARLGQDGRMYLYCSHDCLPRGKDSLHNDMDEYHVYSSSDLVEWRDEGEILRSDDVEGGINTGGFMWAPDCVYKNGKYYFYFPHPNAHPWGANFQTYVAVSDYPNKDFKVLGYVQGIGGDGMIDPCMFIDDDGRNYLFYGGCGMSKCVELEDDMITVKGEIHDLEGLCDYHEGPWVFKRNGIYYMSYPDNYPDRNRMAYAMAKNPLGPWEYKGLYLAPTGSATTHGSVAEMNGRWFCFYHNSAISGDSWLRSVCVDELFFNEDGTIQPVLQTNYPVEPTGEKTPEDPRTATYYPEGQKMGGNVQLEGGGTVYISTPADFIQFKKVDGYKGGRAQIHFTTQRNGPVTAFQLMVNGKDYGAINVLPTGGYEYAEDHFTVTLKPGCTNDITIKWFNGDFRLSCLRVEPLDE